MFPYADIDAAWMDLFNFVPLFKWAHSIHCNIFCCCCCSSTDPQLWGVTQSGLTCEDVVIVVHLVELNALVEHVELFCSQHLALPVSIAWDSLKIKKKEKKKIVIRNRRRADQVNRCSQEVEAAVFLHSPPLCLGSLSQVGPPYSLNGMSVPCCQFPFLCRTPQPRHPLRVFTIDLESTLIICSHCKVEGHPQNPTGAQCFDESTNDRGLRETCSPGEARASWQSCEELG